MNFLLTSVECCIILSSFLTYKQTLYHIDEKKKMKNAK